MHSFVATATAAGYEHEFYLVDLPGVGFAEATKSKRTSWLQLLRQYALERPTLRVLFHLIDSRHGVMDADNECLELLPQLPPNVKYVIVLTKMDKNRGSQYNYRIIDDTKRIVQEKLASADGSYRYRDVPIVITSSMTKQGGVDVWLQILKGMYSIDTDE